MFALLVQRCTELLRDTPTGINEYRTGIFVFSQLSKNNGRPRMSCSLIELLYTNHPHPLSPPVQMDNAEEGQRGEEMEGMVHISASSLDLRELLPSIKVWSDWMLGHPDQWNPPPHSLE